MYVKCLHQCYRKTDGAYRTELYPGTYAVIKKNICPSGTWTAKLYHKNSDTPLLSLKFVANVRYGKAFARMLGLHWLMRTAIEQKIETKPVEVLRKRAEPLDTRQLDRTPSLKQALRLCGITTKNKEAMFCLKPLGGNQTDTALYSMKDALKHLDLKHTKVLSMEPYFDCDGICEGPMFTVPYMDSIIYPKKP